MPILPYRHPYLIDSTGGERGIRTLDPLDRSVSYRGFVAPGAIFAILPDAHYPKLLKSSDAVYALAGTKQNPDPPLNGQKRFPPSPTRPMLLKSVRPRSCFEQYGFLQLSVYSGVLCLCCPFPLGSLVWRGAEQSAQVARDVLRGVTKFSYDQRQRTSFEVLLRLANLEPVARD